MKKWLSSIITLLMLGYIESLELREIMESVKLVKEEMEVANTISNSTGLENSLPDPDVSTVESTRAVENVTNEKVSSTNDVGVTETKHENTADIAILSQNSVDKGATTNEGVTETKHENTADIAIMSQDSVDNGATTNEGVTETKQENTVDIAILSQDSVDNGTTANDGVTNIDMDETAARDFLDLLVKESTDDANVGVFVGNNENEISGKPGFNTKTVTTTSSVLRLPGQDISSLPTTIDEGSRAYEIIWFCYSGAILILSVVMLMFVGILGKAYLRRKRVKDVSDINEKQASDIVASFQSFPTDGDIWREMGIP